MRKRLGWVACGIGVLAATVVALLAYPRPAQTSLSQAYAALERSSVPVQVVGWLQPTDASAQLTDGGYVLVEQTEAFGTLTLRGSRDASRLPGAPAAITWQDSGSTYSLQTAGDPSLVRSHVVPLQVAQQQLMGSRVDTPLLYAVYLPASLVAIVWLTVAVLRRP
jgi:hypothetical protein